ncbi:LacI family DNA-binding transcriptional regulator [Sediminispirochaeta smaragdinae]|uniref:Transcriptional regulator, LacI family n=1 Tax=Sediminispirochaeta smaragdinae (strain DSM 11293 / JCM 15392 / SEBR 4228) TaxID=573413 RepID=E1R9U8_SEDSS|nr:LacI family DNA-binding transcriptional regulator [Sediminispirochaeta smaragdinae]ADK83267.1 transcriptional regulator, LacI family [Sediminispirochaeta smaragdinae DSM 11293]
MKKDNNTMATVSEIAKRCGVSATTVSNIVNHKGRASEATKKKVFSVIKELHYSPNAFARRLKAPKNMKTIGIITEDLTVFNTPEIVDGIEEYSERQGYEVLIENLRFYKRFHADFYNSNQHHSHIANRIKVLMTKRIDGVIYVGCHVRELSLDLSGIPIPVVLAYSFGSNGRIPSVIFDDERAAYDATTALIAGNRRHIGVICGESNSVHTAWRLAGYQRALYDNEILFNPALVVPGGWEFECGYRACTSLFSQPVDAIFAMNDLLAGGVLAYATEHGISVGTDIALIGFDDREICTAYSPTLSSVALPLTDIGREAAKTLFSLIGGTAPAESSSLIKIPCILKQKESTKIQKR